MSDMEPKMNLICVSIETCRDSQCDPKLWRKGTNAIPNQQYLTSKFYY